MYLIRYLYKPGETSVPDTSKATYREIQVTYLTRRIPTNVAALLLALGVFISDATAAKPPSIADELFQFNGRVQYDYTSAQSDQGDASFSGGELRRIYVGGKGKLGKKISWYANAGIDDTGEVSTIAAFVNFRPWGKSTNFRAGQFKVPMSLDESTSSLFTSVLERAAFTDAFDYRLRLGLNMTHVGAKHTLSAGVFGGAVDDKPFSSGKVAAVRVTYTPIKQKKKVLHLATSLRYRESGDDKLLLRYDQKPYFHNVRSIVSSGRIGESDMTVGTELAYIGKSFWLAGERATTAVDCPSCTRQPAFDGHYVEAGWFFNGRRVYRNGRFVRPKVYRPITEGGTGAFSVMVRSDHLNLNDAELTGGSLNTWIIGADWWPTRHSRVSLNYFRVDAALGSSSSGLDPAFSALQSAGIGNEETSGVVLRLQYDF